MPLNDDERAFLLAALKEMVDLGYTTDYARGYEAGMAFVMVTLGISEAASPQRKTL